jgi:photosystem I subunit 3
LYAPAATAVQSTGTIAAVPVRQPSGVRAELIAEPVGADKTVEQVVFTDAPQTSFNWGPAAALIALPTAIAAFLLHRSEGQKSVDLEAPLMHVKLAGAGLAASAVMASGAMMPMPAQAADIAGLTPCAESKKFEKNLTKEVKSLEKRQKLYEAGSEPYLALEATKARTEARFAKYAKSGLLCGADGLPHLIADPGLAVRYGHAGDVFIPTVGFLYIAGYIGTTGRTYLQEISSRQKPTQSEIIIDVPLATSIAFKSWDWPGKAVNELMTGKLVANDADVPVSRR